MPSSVKFGSLGLSPVNLLFCFEVRLTIPINVRRCFKTMKFWKTTSIFSAWKTISSFFKSILKSV